VSDNDNMRSMLSLLRIIEADQQDIDALIAAVGTGGNYRSIRDAQIAISTRNEIKAMTLLANICDEYLSEYPTSYESDCERLTSSGIPAYSNERHALIQVRGEKEVLLFFKDFSETALQLLQVRDNRVFREEIDRVKETKHIVIQQYARGTVLKLRDDDEANDVARK